MSEFALGIVAGIVTSFTGYVIMESVKTKNYTKNVKKLIKSELEGLSSFMTKFLQQPDPKYDSILKIMDKELSDEAHIMLSGKIPSMPYAHFIIFNYNSLSLEDKAKIFDSETLSELEKTYQRIRNYGVLNETGIYSTSKNKLESLKTQIDSVISKL